jgi:hypothetical protein
MLSFTQETPEFLIKEGLNVKTNTFLHLLVFPEVFLSKIPVCDIQGRLIAGPDRKNPDHATIIEVFHAWQKDYQMACRDDIRTFKAIPQSVHDYFQKTKSLVKPTPEMISSIEEALAKGKVIKAPRPEVIKEMPKFTWSYTALNDFETCPLKYAAARYYKTTKFEETEASKWGLRKHKANELALLETAKGLEEDLVDWKYVNAIKQAAKGHTLLVEQQIAINRELKPVDWFAQDVFGRGVVDVAVLKDGVAKIFDWKGLALDTLLPTPSGWTTMEDVKPGDKLFGADGKECSVVAKSEVKNIPCYKLTFCDGSEIVCDEEHLWEVSNRPNGGGKHLPREYNVVSAEEMYKKGVSGLAVDICKALDVPEVELPVPPYTLGCWLGDGKHSDGSITKQDQGIFEGIKKEGFEIGEPHGNGGNADKCPARTVFGLRTLLRNADILRNKHVPAIYFRASIEQRTALAQGLLDTDGSWNFTRNQVVFSTSSTDIARDAHELFCSLGQRAKIHTAVKHGFGITCIAYDVTFTPINGFTPFMTSIKLEKMLRTNTAQRPRNFRRITAIELVESVPTQCIAVDSPGHLYLCGEAMIPTHNTGKEKEDPTQLKIFCIFLALKHKEIQEFESRFIWLKTGNISDPVNLKRTDLLPELKSLLARIDRMEQAWNAEIFQAKRNGLCNQYCSVTDCAHCGRK